MAICAQVPLAKAKTFFDNHLQLVSNSVELIRRTLSLKALAKNYD